MNEPKNQECTSGSKRLVRWLGCLNFLVLQWFSVRLADVREPDGTHVRWKWLKGVVPLTGWWDDYEYFVGKRSGQKQ